MGGETGMMITISEGCKFLVRYSSVTSEKVAYLFSMWLSLFFLKLSILVVQVDGYLKAICPTKKGALTPL